MIIVFDFQYYLEDYIMRTKMIRISFYICKNIRFIIAYVNSDAVW